MSLATVNKLPPPDNQPLERNRYLNVLVIDDNEADCHYYESILSRWPRMRCKITSVHSGKRALSALKDRRFDALLIDYNLPDYYGTDLLDAISEQMGGLTTMPIIMLSGHGDEAVAVDALHRGANDYLNKNKLDAETLTSRLEAALRNCQLQRELEEKQAELEQFASIAAHDMRTWLGVTSSSLDIIEHFDGDKHSPQGQDALILAKKNTKDLLQFMEHLLRYTQVARSSAALKPIDLNTCFADAVARLQERIQSCNATIKKRNELPQVLGDSEAISQLLFNLLGNAIKFCESKPIIAISAHVQRNGYRLSLTDNGIGMPQEKTKEIFSPLIRLHSRGKYDGYGLGLAQCQRIVDQHKGRIWVESTLGVGSTFHIFLPAT